MGKRAALPISQMGTLRRRELQPPIQRLGGRERVAELGCKPEAFRAPSAFLLPQRAASA